MKIIKRMHRTISQAVPERDDCALNMIKTIRNLSGLMMQTTGEGLKNYKKSEYDKDGYKDGTAERNYGDSCLVVNYATQIGKRILQQSASTQAEKSGL